MFRSLQHPYILLCLTVLFWAGNTIVGRAFSEDMPPLTMNFWRWFIAAAILLPICWAALKKDKSIILSNLPYVFMQGLLSITAFNSLLYWGLHYTTVVNTALIQAGMPVVTLFFSILILKKGVTRLGGLGIFLSLCGVTWVVARGDYHNLAKLQLNTGDVIMLTSVVCWAIYSVMLARMPQGISRLSFTFSTVCAGLIILLPLYLWEYSTGARIHLNQQTLLAFAYVGIFPSVLSLIFWNKAVEMVGANTAGVFLNLMPIFGATLGVLLLGERLETFHYVGIIFIIIGIRLVTYKSR